MHYFLVEFSYEHYCQGYEWVTERLLVQSGTFEDACEAIRNRNRYSTARKFENKTMLWGNNDD